MTINVDDDALIGLRPLLTVMVGDPEDDDFEDADDNDDEDDEAEEEEPAEIREPPDDD